jgi:AbrB family looped-hinge helix DNA binding protein
MEVSEMTIIETAKITSKGQVTIPNRIRKLLHVQSGASVAFVLSRQGVTLLPCKVTVESPYTPEEWKKIERLASVKGRVYRSDKEAKKHIEAL